MKAGKSEELPSLSQAFEDIFEGWCGRFGLAGLAVGAIAARFNASPVSFLVPIAMGASALVVSSQSLRRNPLTPAMIWIAVWATAGTISALLKIAIPNWVALVTISPVPIGLLWQSVREKYASSDDFDIAIGKMYATTLLVLVATAVIAYCKFREQPEWALVAMAGSIIVCLTRAYVCRERLHKRFYGH